MHRPLSLPFPFHSPLSRREHRLMDIEVGLFASCLASRRQSWVVSMHARRGAGSQAGGAQSRASRTGAS
ncbi:uncharacterized protein ARMOST_13722 [Armillaria ostoyae]|uniref:Uncharacterized protein n=1 Tax=Armillaria ostoyae TaxID=47428 RepID=A0A284RNM7_ARMOS|nr:uncharacterized protein ARMOST_13722 [Armillaria ostoyae]